MRKIKFRVWDKHNMRSKMMYSETEVFDDMIGFRFEHFDGDLEDLVLMQWTGMEDKNGNDIYEGDICKLTSKEYYSNHYFSIDENWEMTCIVKFNSYMYLFKEVKDRYKEILLWEVNKNDIDVEVLGNIYENPELIKE